MDVQSDQTSDVQARRIKAAKKSLEELRTKLLDLSNRNRLLNYRHSKTARQLRFVNASLTSIFSALGESGGIPIVGLPDPDENGNDTAARALANALETARLTDAAYHEAIGQITGESDFEAAERDLRRRLGAEIGVNVDEGASPEDVARSLGIDPSLELPRENGSPVSVLQSLLFPDPLERKLSAIYDESRSTLQEVGINTLYVSLAFLEWYETDNSEKALLSPLVLVPVQLNRSIQRGRYVFSLSHYDEEVEGNITLAERLSSDFRITLPTYETDMPISDYLQQAEETIEPNRRWRIRTFATLGLLNFARLAMYKDLDPARRTGAAALENKAIIIGLLGGLDAPDPVPGTEQPDEYTRAAPLLISDADASQYSAICEAVSGKSFEILGPPGTGKSQTITNIIGAALSANKTVLFVAEKLAALQVVKARLDAADLGEFCLELHSTKSRKTDVHEALKKRFAIRRSPRPDDTTLPRDIQHYRGQIENYADALHSDLGALGLSVFDLIWREQSLRLELGDAVSRLQALAIPDAETITTLRLAETKAILTNIVDRERSYVQRYGAVALHPLRSLDLTTIAQSEMVELRRATQNAIAAVQGLAEALADLRFTTRGVDFTPSEADALAAVRDLISRLALTSSAGVLDASKLTNPVHCRSMATSFTTSQATLKRSPAALIAALDPPTPASIAFHGALTACAPQPDATLETLLDHQASLAGEIERLSRGVALASEAEAVLWPDGKLTTARLRAIERATAVAAPFDDAAAAEINSGSFSSTNLTLLRDGSAQAAALRTELANLGDTFNLATPTDDNQLRAMADVLENTNPLAFLLPKTWTARGFYRRLAHAPKSIPRSEMAAQLRSLADCLQRVDAFSADIHLTHILGNQFTGLTTNFAPHVDAATYADLLTRALEPLGAAGTDLLHRALANPHETMKHLLRCSRDERYPCLKETDTLIPDNRSIETEIARRTEDLDRLDTAIRFWSQAGFPSETSVAELDATHHASVALHASSEDIAADPEAAGFLGPAPRSAQTLAEKCAAIDYVIAVRAQHLDEAIVTDLLRQVPDEKRLSAISDASATLAERIASLEKVGNLNTQSLCMTPLADTPLAELAAALEGIASALDTLPDWLSYQRQKRTALSLGLGDLLSAHALILTAPLELCYEYTLVRTLLQVAHTSHEHLADANGARLTQARTTFQHMDKAFLLANRKWLRSELSLRHIPAGNNVGRRSEWTDMALLNNEMQKSKRHVPIRDLNTRAGAALRAAKPCFMMSPLTVSQFLPASVEFDIVVIDEASQMRPEDALGAVSRAKQLIVVGDPKQLPPTSFFDRVDADNGDEVSDEDALEVESILDLASQQYRTSRQLTWHYRSLHESLIAFSNKYFYGDELLIFPSPDRGPDLGVRSHYVGGRYQTSVNPTEAQHIVRRALEIMRDEPHHSLAIVTMNQPQRELIHIEYERAILTEPYAQRYETAWEERLEPLIIRNLESIQGDERDIVLISTVYGPDAESGKVFQRFGPINSRAGWRRLNVLFTRAKRRVEVITSMRSADIVYDQGTGRGVKALRDYLEFADTGQLEAGDITGRPPESDFEVAVARMLDDYGYRSVPQVGVAGFFIDLGVIHPDNPNRFVLGVECDGRAYHSTKSARDRDRLRQEILESRGWRLHRIWSTDWFANPQHELKRLVEAIEVARLGKTIAPALDDEEPAESNLRDGRDEQTANATPPDDLPDPTLLARLTDLIPPSGSILRERLLSDVAFTLNEPLTKQLRSALNRAISSEVRAGRLQVDTGWTTVRRA